MTASAPFNLVTSEVPEHAKNRKRRFFWEHEWAGTPPAGLSYLGGPPRTVDGCTGDGGVRQKYRSMPIAPMRWERDLSPTPCAVYHSWLRCAARADELGHKRCVHTLDVFLTPPLCTHSVWRIAKLLSFATSCASCASCSNLFCVVGRNSGVGSMTA